MQSPSNLPVHDLFSSNYESLYLKEKEKNAILVARINEKESLIHHLHQANNEAYSEINQMEEKLSKNNSVNHLNLDILEKMELD